MSIMEQRSRRRFLQLFGSVGTAALTGGCVTLMSESLPVIFHAGSLTPPFSQLEKHVKKQISQNLLREPSGSVIATRKITASPHKPASVLGVADFRLLRDMLLPEYGTWYALFATNAMTIHYTESSPGSSALTRDNWWEILQQDNITIGYSDPARDPAGYRAEMVLELGTIPFRGTQLYENDIYEALKQNTTVTAGDEIHLISQLKSGKIDYAINYRSLARTANIEYLSLQPQVNLAKFTEQYATHYHRASVQTSSGTYRGAPIAYGVTIPTTRRFPRIGQQFIKALLSSTGTDILQSHGFRPITPAIGTSIQSDGIPQSITPLIKNRQTFGPLSLRP